MVYVIVCCPVVVSGASDGAQHFIPVWLKPGVFTPRELMNETTVRKTYKEKLRPTPAQERALEEVLWRCRALYNTALEQRITWLATRPGVSRHALSSRKPS